MKLTSPSRKRSSPAPRSPESSPASSRSASSRHESLGLDSQEESPAGGGTPTSARYSPALRAPASQVRRTVSGVRAEITGALSKSAGADAQLRAALEQADDGRRLDSVLKGGADQPTYALILDHLHAVPPSAETHGLITRFGADLLHAAIWAGDLPRLRAACELFGPRLPALATRDTGRVFLSAALVDPRAASVLLDHLPDDQWGAVLNARKGAALAALFGHLVAPSSALSEAGRAQAAPTLDRLFSGVDPGLLNRLYHRSPQVQRFVQVGRRESPALLEPLAECLKARGGVVPWGTP